MTMNVWVFFIKIDFINLFFYIDLFEICINLEIKYLCNSVFDFLDECLNSILK